MHEAGRGISQRKCRLLRIRNPWSDGVYHGVAHGRATDFLRTLDPKEYDTQDAYDKALTDHLTTLYIIYSNAPYVGLLGTVLGIMITFYDMGTTGNINAGEIMTGLSLALKATALGLAVAIPTLIVYNGLQRKINVLSTQWKEAHAK